MALSMLVLIVPVFLVVGLYRFLGHETPPPLDTAEVYGSVQRAGQFEALKPEQLPSGWRIVSITYTDGVLRIGVTAPGDGAMQVAESAKPKAELVPAILGKDSQAAGDVTVNGSQWERWTPGRPGERAILQTTGTRTVIVFGQGKAEQLSQLAGSLKA
ncbi:hypothetical protein GCM10010170_066970 [Dactylosporangium salmoneum]|uniref:DUF4245 domain-containing protein n=2 Tax=Dactylosporangium salmoneum TaxID=53361 RepID=A0ABN3H2E1_9ACTN